MEIGKESLLYSECSRWDYVDRYRFAVADPGDRIGLSDLAEAFVGPGPRWVEGLFALRNRIVSVFGFKTPAARGKNAAGHGGKWESGERVGIFEVLARSTDEIVLGDNDRHLDLRVSLLVERGGRDGREKTLSVTTAVRLNDRLGRCYFCFIKPFHRMITVFRTGRRKIDPPRTIAGRIVSSGVGRGYFSVPSCACWIIWSLAVMSISTRRFCARPSSVELSAIGES